MVKAAPELSTELTETVARLQDECVPEKQQQAAHSDASWYFDGWMVRMEGVDAIKKLSCHIPLSNYCPLDSLSTFRPHSLLELNQLILPSTNTTTARISVWQLLRGEE